MARNPMHPERLAGGFLSDLLADWAVHGRDAIERFRRSRPDRYIRLVAAMSSKPAAPAATGAEAMTDAELERALHDALAELQAAGDKFPSAPPPAADR